MIKRTAAYPLFLIYSGLTAFGFSMAFTVASLYEVTVAGLNPLQLVLVGTTLEVAVFLFEVPTGVVADSFSRRLSIIIGLFLVGAGFITEGLLPFFVPILLAQVLWGVGYTFTSGALQAWISDEIGEERANQAFLRARQLEMLTGLAGIAAGTLLGRVNLAFPLVACGALMALLGLGLIFTMPENGFKPTPSAERTTWGNMFETFRGGLRTVRQRPALRAILWIGLFYGLYSEGFDRLWVAHLLEHYTLPWAEPVVWMGLLRGTAMLLSVAAVEMVQRRVDVTRLRSLAGWIAAASAGIVLSLAGFAVARWLPAALLLYLIISVLRNWVEPLYTAWVNQRLDSQVRATVLSMSSQVDAIGQIGGGPLVGLVAQQVSITAALLTSSALLTPVLGLIRPQLRAPNPPAAGQEQDLQD